MPTATRHFTIEFSHALRGLGTYRARVVFDPREPTGEVLVQVEGRGDREWGTPAEYGLPKTTTEALIHRAQALAQGVA